MSNGRLWPEQNWPIINRSIFHTLRMIMVSAGLLMFQSSITLSAPQYIGVRRVGHRLC